MPPAKKAAHPPVDPAEWQGEHTDQHTLPGLFTFHDAKNTYLAKDGGERKRILQLLPGSGGTGWQANGSALEHRSECNIDGIFAARELHRWAKAPKLIAIGFFDLVLHKPGEGKQAGPKLTPAEKVSALESMFEKQEAAYDERDMQRASEAGSQRVEAGEAQLGGNSFDPGAGGLARQLRLCAYPLKHSTAQQVWTEAQHGGLARALAPKINGGVPTADLVSVTALLCTLSVRAAADRSAFEHSASAGGRKGNAVGSPVVALQVDLDDLVGLLRTLFANPQSDLPPDPETAAKECTLPVGQQALFLALFALPNSYSLKWYDKVEDARGLERMKHDKGRLPARADALRAFQLLGDARHEDGAPDDGAASIGTPLETVIDAVVEEIQARPDLLQPLVQGVVVMSGTTFHREAIVSHFEQEASSIGPASVDGLHSIVTRLSALVSKTKAEHQRSGFVEDLSMEHVAVPKDLPPQERALVVLFIELLSSHAGGEAGLLYQMLHKKARVGRSSDSDGIGTGAVRPSSRSMSEEDKRFHEALASSITNKMPDKQVIDAAFLRLAGGSAATRGPHAERLREIDEARQFLVSAEKSLLEPVMGNASGLDAADATQLNEIREKKRKLNTEEMGLRGL